MVVALLASLVPSMAGYVAWREAGANLWSEVFGVATSLDMYNQVFY